jgi:hypothetical protein
VEIQHDQIGTRDRRVVARAAQEGDGLHVVVHDMEPVADLALVERVPGHHHIAEIVVHDGTELVHRRRNFSATTRCHRTGENS